MGTKSKPPPVVVDALRSSVAYAVRSHEWLRVGIGDALAARLEPPPVEQHARRFVFGFTAPFTLFRIAWGNAEIRSSIRRRLLPPLACVALATVVGIGSLIDDMIDARRNPAVLTAEARDDDDEDDRHDEDAKRSEAANDAAVKAAVDARSHGASAMDAAEAAIAAAKAQAKPSIPPPPPPPPTGRLAVFHAMLLFLRSKLAKLIATLSVIEWLLVWIGREHHDQIAYDTAVLTGVPGEALPRPPRLRFDFAWLRVKGWRALRFLIFVALAAPIAWLVEKTPFVGEAFATAIGAAWGAYWASVFAIGNTFLAWEKPVPAGEAPWFVRVLLRPGRIPIVGIPFRLYARVLTLATRNVWPACMAFERTTWEATGLALARVIASMPVVYMISRPMFTPAATHAMLARADAPLATTTATGDPSELPESQPTP